jgi:hypothetical protein
LFQQNTLVLTKLRRKKTVKKLSSCTTIQRENVPLLPGQE